ncbi:MAG: carboxypeptidase regulatory-like domain-containing protein [Terriglobia bacterium]
MANFRKLMFVAVALVTLLALWPRTGQAQTVYGSIAGTVLDASGGAIPGAAVTLTNTGTGEKHTMPSEASGGYTFVNILPGTYRIEAEKSGFKHFKRDGIIMEVGSAFRVDLPMEVGAVTQTIEVTAQTPLLQPQSSDLGQVVESRTVTEMPLNGRNVISLVQLSPGIQPQGPPSGGNSSMSNPVGANPFASSDFQIGGSQAGQNAIFVDGVPTNGSYLNVITLIPTQDAIQEFKVQTNSMGPDFGRFAGGVVNMTTKTGSNSWHGAGWEFLRNKVLDANNYFLNAAGGTGNNAVGPWTQNQFGADVGGKVITDKLFFFSSYEGYRVRSSAVLTSTVPTTAMLQGTFATPIYDPTTSGLGGNAACTPTGGTCRTQIGPTASGGSQLTPANFPTASTVMLGLFQAPTNSNATNNFVKSYGTGGDTDQANERVDYDLSQKQRLFARFTYYKLLNLPDSPFKDICTDRCTENIHTKQIALGDTYTFSPTTILDLHLGYTRYDYVRTPLTAGYNMSSLGGAWATYQFNSTPIPVPCVSNNSGDDLYGGGFCSAGSGSEIGAGDDTWSFTPSLTKIKGRNTLKMGYEFRLLRNNYYQTNQPTGVWQFDRAMTAANPLASGITTGNGMASLELGWGSNSSNSGTLVTPSQMANQIFYNAMYISDTLQATHRLTLNLGLRYDLQGNWTERFNRILDWYPNAASPLNGALAGVTNPVTGASLSNLTGAFALVDSTGNPARSEANLPTTEFNPRIGLAYRLNDRTVIRSGYGIFYLPNDIAWNTAPHNLFINSYTTPWLTSVANADVTPINNFSNPLPNGVTQPPGRNQAFINTDANGPSADWRSNPPSYSQEWNFDIQRELPDGTLIDVAYAGSKGTHLPMHNQDVDQLPPQDMPAADGTAGPAGYGVVGVSPAMNLKTNVANPFQGIVAENLLGSTVSTAQMLLPYPQFTDVSLAEPDDRDSIYHSLQVKVDKRFSHGGTLMASYTVSKLISDTNNEINWLGDAAPSWGDLNAYNLHQERSQDGFDVPQRFVLGYVLDLPVGKGKKFASGLSPVANKIVGGWGIDGIITLQSGFPLNISGGSNALGNAGISESGGTQPTRTGHESYTSGSKTSRLDEWFTTSVFSNTTTYTRGNDSRTEPELRQDAEKNMDFAAFKKTTFGPDDRLGLEFRAEFFNFFNHPQFASPNTSLGSGTFGVVSSQYNLPRLIQFGLRLSF